jgi:hypothetical protein
MGCMLLLMPFNMCTKRITILMQVNENSWKARYYLNFKDNHTWHHDSLTKLHFIKSTSVNYIIFYHFYKLHQISYGPTKENLWLLSITLFRWNLIIWRSHQCGMVYWMIFHIFIFTLCISWITLAKDILVELLKKYYTSQFSPHMTFASLPTKSCLVLFCHTPRRICNFQLAMNKKRSKAPTNLFFCINNILLIDKTIQKWSHLLQTFNFTPNTHTNVHNI